MCITTKFIIIELVIVMNPIIIDHDVTARSETPERMSNLGRSTCTIENLEASTFAMLTMLSRVRLG